MHNYTNKRNGYAVHSPQGCELFDLGEEKELVGNAIQNPRRWVQKVILAEQDGRAIWLPVNKTE